MYLEHFGLREFPFTTAADPRFYYPTAKHKEALACLLYAVEQRCGFALITGEVGAGKTMLCRAALARFADEVEVAPIVHTSLSPLEFLQALGRKLGVQWEDRPKVELLGALEADLRARHEAGRNVVLMVDEAQGLREEVLEEIRLLGNLEAASDKLLQIVLVGQPELRRLIGTPRMRPLDQRMAIRFHLGQLSPADIDGYVEHRLGVAGAERTGIITPAARAEVHRASGGLPRRVNILCDQALLQAYVRDEAAVSAEAVRSVVRDMAGYYMDTGGPPRNGEPAPAAAPEAASPPAEPDEEAEQAPAPHAPEPGDGEPWEPALAAPGAEWQTPSRPPRRPAGRPEARRRAMAPAGPPPSVPSLAHALRPEPPAQPAAPAGEQLAQRPSPATGPKAERFADIAELAHALAVGMFEPVFADRAGDLDVAACEGPGVPVDLRLTRAHGRNYLVLLAHAGHGEHPDTKQRMEDLVARLGYVHMAGESYMRSNGGHAQTLKIGADKIGLACSLRQNPDRQAVAKCLLVLHEELAGLAEAAHPHAPAQQQPLPPAERRPAPQQPEGTAQEERDRAGARRGLRRRARSAGRRLVGLLRGD